MFQKLITAFAVLGILLASSPQAQAQTEQCSYHRLASWDYYDAMGTHWWCSEYQFSDCSTGSTCVS